jgi:2-desacetyl-2-hydroxyethyl bacteriochlorophyllide A dehydrogenase
MPEMRTIVLADYAGLKDTFDPAKFSLQSTPVPEPEDEEVLIKVMASSVNPVDWKMTSGVMQQMSPLQFPFIPGFDCSGLVTAVGKDVSRVKVGDQVWTDVASRTGGRPGKLKLGAYAEYVAVKENKVSLKPSNLSYEEAAVVPLVGLTALQGLRKAEAVEGSSILVLGGSAAVGIAAIQIGKAKGMNIYTTCSTKNVDFVKGLGADEVIDYTSGDWAELLKDKNIDGVFDTVGEKDALTRSFGVLKEAGSFVTLTGLGNPPEPMPKGVKAAFILTNSDTVEDLDELKSLIESGKLTIRIHETFALDKVPDAFKMSMGGKVVGKICIRVSAADNGGKAQLAKGKLYANMYCPFASRALFAAGLFEPEFEIIPIPLAGQLAFSELTKTPVPGFDLSLEDTKAVKEKYKTEVNPSGAVPVFVNGEGATILESEIVAEYLVEASGAMSPEPLTRAKVNMANKVFNDLPGAVFALLGNQDPAKDEELGAAVAKKVTAWAEKLDADSAYCFGDEVTMADVHAAPFLWRFSHALSHFRGYDIFAGPKGERVRKFMDKVLAHPAFLKHVPLSSDQAISGFAALAHGNKVAENPTADAPYAGRGRSTMGA